MIPCSWVDWHPQKLVRSFFMDVPVSSSSIELPMSMKMRSQWFNLFRHILKQISLVSTAHFSRWIIVSKDRDKNWATIIHWELAVLAITDKWDVGNEIKFTHLCEAIENSKKIKTHRILLFFCRPAVQLFLTRPMLFLSNNKGNVIIVCSNWKSPVRMHPW